MLSTALHPAIHANIVEVAKILRIKRQEEPPCTILKGSRHIMVATTSTSLLCGNDTYHERGTCDLRRNAYTGHEESLQEFDTCSTSSFYQDSWVKPY